MRKLWLALFILVLTVAFLGPSFAAPKKGHSLLPRQSGLYMWSSASQKHLQIDLVVDSIQRGYNDLFRRVLTLEQRIEALEQN